MQAAPGTWFQAYLPGDEAQIDALIDRVAAAGVTTLVLTVDTPVAATITPGDNVRAGFFTPLRPSAALAWQGLAHPRWRCSGTVHCALWRRMECRISRTTMQAAARRYCRRTCCEISRTGATSAGVTRQPYGDAGRGAW